MSNRKPSDRTRSHKVGGSLKEKPSLSRLSRPPTPLSIITESDSSSDNRLDLPPTGNIPVVGIDHVPTTTEVSTPTPIIAPVSSAIPAVPGQFGPTRLEAPPTHMSAVGHIPLGTVSAPYSFTQAATGLKGNTSNPNSFFTKSRGVRISGGNFTINNAVNKVKTDNEQIKTFVSCKPNPSQRFIGRRDVLDKLMRIFVHSAGKSRHSCLLWGTGGIGKTQICLKFVEEISDRVHVFWVDASSLESINMSFKGISGIPAAQASCLDGSAESVLRWISGIQGEWLIVFDNADNLSPDEMAKFIPPGNRGNILITSRNRSMRRLAFENIIEVNVMEEADAIALLFKASYLDASTEHLRAAKHIVTLLGCLPLAVDHAGAYIEAGCNIIKYLIQFSTHRQTLMLDARFRGASNYDQTVYGTWDLSLREIKERARDENAQGNKAAILILGICAFYHHINISEDIFQSAAESGKYVEMITKLSHAVNSLDCTLFALHKNGHWDDFIYEQGISVLVSFSLIKRDQRMLSIHPLIHCWSRDQMSKPDQQRMYEIGTTILSCAISRRLTSHDYWLRQLIFTHIKANELHGSEMGLKKQCNDDICNNFRFVMEEIGDWNNAEQLAIQVLDMRKRLLGAEHLDTLITMEDLAKTYHYQGKLNKAEQLQAQVLDMRKKILGAEHPDTLISMGNLASTYCYQGKLIKAEQLEVQVLDLSKKLFGAEHPHTLIRMGNLARTYYHQRKLNKAEQLEVHVLDLSKKLLGEEHPHTLIRMGNLARTYSYQRKLNEAEQLEVQVLDLSKKLHGVEHPHTLIRMRNLARIYQYQGKLNEAHELEVQVLDIRKKLLDAGHLDTFINMKNMARNV